MGRHGREVPPSLAHMHQRDPRVYLFEYMSFPGSIGFLHVETKNFYENIVGKYLDSYGALWVKCVCASNLSNQLQIIAHLDHP
jgi:hypothetical protein